ncbi:hypothetical protein HYV88_02050 [Candidatus Woesearchaeota archaeon]|nr:hypothetical protein [Candidatus Woesearchaeota archaeon]
MKLSERILKEIAVRLPTCLDDKFGVLDDRERQIKSLLNEGLGLVPLVITSNKSSGIGRVEYIIGFVNWMLDKGHYSGQLSEYFRKRLEGLKECDRLALNYQA